ncbi:MAG: hypothetical protein AB7O68_16610 [Pirellulales bacterium]
MVEQPPRRWLRFRLSTVLILTAIAAWAMACRPWGQYKHDALSIPALTKTIHFEVRWDIPNVSSERPFPTPSNNIGFALSASFASAAPVHFFSLVIGPRLVVWPALALLSFLTWKAAWTVVERRRRQPVAPE